jgi:signal transduction histidine kinase
MALRSDNTALAVLCGPSGALAEVVCDEFGLQQRLAPGKEFSGIVAPFHKRKVSRFWRTLQAGGSALDWELAVTLPRGVVPLFFSGCVSSRGTIIIGTKEPLATASGPRNLATLAEKHSEAIGPAIQPLHTRREGKAKAEQRLRRQLARLNQTLVAHGKSAKPNRAQDSRADHLRLLEIAAHDLRNPISGILAATEYLIEDASRVLEPHHVALLCSIESSSRLMLRLLQDMLEIPTIGTGKVQLELHPTDIGLLVERAVASNQPLAETRRVRMELSIEKHLPAITADAGKLTHALDGLLTSVIRSSHLGSRVELTAAAQTTNIVISLRHEASSDSVDTLKALFHPPHADRPKRGLSDERAALTLALVRRIVEAHHGKVLFETGPKQESSITLSLPAAGAGRASGSRRSTAEEARLPRDANQRRDSRQIGY